MSEQTHPFHLQNVSKTYPGSPPVLALDGVSLQVGAGEFVALVGPSGCGKSTLLSLLAGIEPPDSGTITQGPRSLIGNRETVGYMLQDDLLFPWMTILDNVALPLRVTGQPLGQARRQAAEQLAAFGLEAYAAAYPAALSGGMRQRAAFLRTQLTGRPLLALDEPFARLDALTRLQMQQWLLTHWENTRPGILLVTHDIDEAIYLADRIYVMSPRPGRIVATLTVPLERPRHMTQRTEPAFSTLKANILHLLVTA